MCLAFMGLGPMELLILVAILLLLFGSSLPSIMRSMGRSVGEFKAGLSDKPDEESEKLPDGSVKPTIEEK